MPPTRTVPSVASYRRQISWISVDLLAPVPPIMPTVMPDLISRSISSRTIFCAFAAYLKLTWSNVMLPSGTSMTGWAWVTQGTRLVQHLKNTLG